MGTTLAANIASANPGSQILVYWVSGSTGNLNVCLRLFYPFRRGLVFLPVALRGWAYHALHGEM